ncbi:DNA topoisomerase IV subunit A [Thermofilum pendens]|uniref:Type 2 DNA topoisomerase 6 subunit A n=1 Tax=Thermofilum pendens (strain DSM 2475 / Hrk 5) TaxID=368408 RepID=A1RXY9_THEPD|nr:DNA topoisomerase IV subunit A [Thermofilum pendens]ABL78069.1 Spo11/DNA topoisomerase [Thermofilum pendens Hrk 5]
MSSQSPKGKVAAPSDSEVLAKLESLAKKLVEQMESGVPPYLVIPVRTMANTIWDRKRKLLVLGPKTARREFFDIGESKRFMQTVLMLSLIVQARREGDYPTIRELYYRGKRTIKYTDERGNKASEETWDDQRESNAVIQDIEVATGLLREHMGVTHDAKGRIVGNMIIRSKGDEIDLSKMGSGAWGIPSFVDKIEILRVEADYVLVVEKGAVFEKLNEEEFWKKNNCILVTGKGQPDRSTRRMVRRLWEEFGLPVYILTDGDSYGFYIYSVYRSGSISLSYESERLATPEARFLGVSPSDIERYELQGFTIKATERDLKRAKELMNYPWFKESKRWMEELELFLEKKEKVEIEAFAKHGLKYLSSEYIPKKIKNKQWII